MKNRLCTIFFFIVLIIVYIYIDISKFKVKTIVLNSNKISNDINIVQISDFHNNKLINKRKLLKKIEKINPDIIVLTGDIIDSNTKDFNYTLGLIKNLIEINSNICFVYGNHEIRNDNGNKFIMELKKIGVVVLDNQNRKTVLNGNDVNICGINFYINKLDYDKSMENIDEKNYTILLSHSPNRPLKFLNGKEDLILAGHTHGGQVRLPIIGAIIAPGQGYFPKYNKGLYKLGNTVLYIDSGLGNSALPIRFLNRVQFSHILVRGSHSL